MARRTTCTTVANIWDGLSAIDFGRGLVGAAFLAAAAIIPLVAALSTSGITPASIVAAGICLMIGCLQAIDTVNTIRDAFFDHKLICLDGDQCAIAQVISIEENDDGDHSMNTLLAPAIPPPPIPPPPVSPPIVLTTEPLYQGMFQPQMLVYDPPGPVPGLTAELAARGYVFNPFEARRPLLSTNLPFFHCEVEGTRFDDFTNALLAFLYLMLALAVAAIALGTLGLALGPLAWAIWGLLALFIFLALLLGLRISGGGHDDVSSLDAAPVGIPSVTGPVIMDSGGQSVRIYDYVALLGRHVCDAGHKPDCWKELHPVKGIAKITPADYAMVVPDESGRHLPGDIYDKYCDALRIFVTSVGEVKLKLASGDERLAEVTDPATLRPLCLEHRVVG